MGNRLLKYMLVSYGLSALIGIMSILTGGIPGALNLLGTSLTLSGALTLLLLAFLLRKSGAHRLRHLMSFSVVMTIVSALISLGLIWISGLGQGGPWETFLASLTLSLSSLHIGYLFHWKRLNTLFRVVIWVLSSFNVFLVLIILMGLFYSPFFDMVFQIIDGDLFGRIIGAMVVLLLIGTVSLPVMNLILRGRDHEKDKGMSVRRVSVPVSCPRCSFASELKVGHNTCPQCKLAMQFMMEEPRCSCGYLLYRCEAASCPECSRAIPAHLRWEDLSPSSGLSG